MEVQTFKDLESISREQLRDLAPENMGFIENYSKDVETLIRMKKTALRNGSFDSKVNAIFNHLDTMESSDSLVSDVKEQLVVIGTWAGKLGCPSGKVYNEKLLQGGVNTGRLFLGGSAFETKIESELRDSSEIAAVFFLDKLYKHSEGLSLFLNGVLEPPVPTLEASKEVLHMVSNAIVPDRKWPIPSFIQSIRDDKTSEPYDSENLSTIITHFFGDSFAKNSYLEGSTSEVMLPFLATATKRIGESLGADMKGRVASIQSSAIKGQLLRDLYKERKPEEIKRFLSEMKSGESVIIPYGWSGDPGHATYLEFVKDGSDGTGFSVKHFNLGGGCNDYQNSIYDSKKGQYCYFPYTLQKDISISKLAQPVFVGGYNDLMDGPDYGEKKFDSNDIYSLLNVLGPMSKKSEETVSDYQVVQHSGLCAWHSLSAMVKDKCSKSEYANYYMRVGLDVIYAFHQHCR